MRSSACNTSRKTPDRLLPHPYLPPSRCARVNHLIPYMAGLFGSGRLCIDLCSDWSWFIVCGVKNARMGEFGYG